jgi:hypothetical protein
LLSGLENSSTLKTEVTYSFDMSVDFQWATRRYISEDRTHYHHCEILKS